MLKAEMNYSRTSLLNKGKQGTQAGLVLMTSKKIGKMRDMESPWL